ncbi:MAG: hypothetical protein HOI02_02940 [Rhodospirillaceae bacterium]|nr:hypothetical protein [Rhodospirillaceae bacterium]MBT5778346.1 hypothetical protein [Rhodospirillaceae bacterium]
MAWRKIGRIFRAEGQRDFMVSHASCPQAVQQDGDLYRIWFAPRDKQNRSYCAWLDIDITKPTEILRLAETPSVAPGALGAFDEQGAMFSWVMSHAGESRIYYTGWNIGDTVPFRNAIGMASASGPDGEFIPNAGPVLDRSAMDPYFVGNPCVLFAAGNWHLWYLSGTAWSPASDTAPARASYNLRHALSPDGVNWTPDSAPAVDYFHPGEMAIARPSVRYADGLFRMHYSWRGTGYGYRAGYAESADGSTWRRLDEGAGAQPSEEGWDSEMIAYPQVFEHSGQTYMLYCGNGFSAAGFGLAVLED